MVSATLPRIGQPVSFDPVAGIDTHRDFHVAVDLAPNGGKLAELTFPTSRKGYEQQVAWSEQFGVRPVFAMEGTSSYGACLCRVRLDAEAAARAFLPARPQSFLSAAAIRWR
jgi:hypothetical protein